jgi:hypothetical protein
MPLPYFIDSIGAIISIDVGKSEGFMLSCPNCQLQYPNQTIRCEPCNVPLVDLPPQAATPIYDDHDLDPVELAGFQNVSEAEMIQELLEQNNIKTVVQGEVDPIGIASKAETTRLLVEKKGLAQAQEIYDAYFSGNPAESALSDQEQH